MSTLRIGENYFRPDGAGYDGALANAYLAKARPLCVCRDPAVEMYIAKIDGHYIVKRMPNTGPDHSPNCDSYEPPAELSGYGQVAGNAIQENPEEGVTTLKLDFSLTKLGGRAAQVASSVESDSVITSGNKLTLRGVLHYMWEEAGFNRWSPAMQGKRNWYVIRKYLLHAAQSKKTKGQNLAELIYAPESFSQEKAGEITQRRLAQFNRAAAVVNGSRKLMIGIGMVKDLAESRYAFKLIFKHAPDCPFMLDEELHKKLRKRFDRELSLWGTLDSVTLMAICTFYVNASGIPSIEEIALMPVTENWIPFDTLNEKELIDAMTRSGRRFQKGLRYNLPSTRPLACMVAFDTQPKPTAMYVVGADVKEDYLNALTELTHTDRLDHWTWKVGDGVMPALPPQA